jgi:hypothetical protein
MEACPLIAPSSTHISVCSGEKMDVEAADESETEIIVMLSWLSTCCVRANLGCWLVNISNEDDDGFGHKRSIIEARSQT